MNAIRPLLAVAVSLCALASPALAAKGSEKLFEMSLDRWAKLRETERYQLNVAEKYFREGNYAVAAGEYEKFLTLYETSEGAPYAQLKWSRCQVLLQQLNTAVKDGYQTVIDYWPDSPEAVAAAYLIGETYKAMGDLPKAKQAYQKVLEQHADEVVAVRARLDLADIARIELDRPKRVQILKDLVQNAPRTGDAGPKVVDASQTLSELLLEDGNFADARAALATSYQEPQLAEQVWHSLRRALPRLAAADDTKERGIKTADAAVAYFNQLRPAAPKDDAEKKRSQDLGFHAADAYAWSGRMKEGRDVYERLVSEFGDDQVLVAYGHFLRERRNWVDARAVYGRMKNQVEALRWTAWAYREEQKPLSAVPIYEDLLTRDTAKTSNWQWELAQAYHHGGKYKEAIAAYQQADNMPSNLQQIAECYKAMQQFKEAMGMYAQILGAYEGQPAARWALLQLAYTQEQTGQTETAIKTFQAVCKKYPNSDEGSRAHTHLFDKYKITATK